MLLQISFVKNSGQITCILVIDISVLNFKVSLYDDTVFLIETCSSKWMNSSNNRRHGVALHPSKTKQLCWRSVRSKRR